MLFWHIEGHKWQTNRHFYVIYSRNRLYLKIYIYAMHRPEMYMVLHLNNNNSDVLSSMVTHTRNWCSAFNPSKCAHTQQWVVNKHTHTHSHPEQWAAIAPAPGEQLGVRCLLKGYWRWRECCSFTIPTFNSCQCENRTSDLQVTSPTL